MSEWYAHLNMTDDPKLWRVVVTPTGPDQWEVPPARGPGSKRGGDYERGRLRVLLEFEHRSELRGALLRAEIEGLVREMLG